MNGKVILIDGGAAGARRVAEAADGYLEQAMAHLNA